ncbi:Uncharacterised protein [Mycobacteroides abscessus subsp. abscessus]|uniref:hypothetical protein n=1 Tax=Mycobacteroides abscessus TaxID=36809 RepID=UPI0009293846|nr:hypothetical protein [Mycobacteroides abscessus]SHS93403.1 Uncharacterised protein [Mycobacteroides abscessus subsp. abscessus]SIK81905.1 Uncharacterised protein [Mycobacteroides abscessus subsp. abscessus]SLE26849.1 Uncharacterised protein [Mycobacteroides abscessus subsp. abscessus]SLK69070.1 Uncharacterised protein [Mycobacteroides abscessus subsp. abscessus]
MLIAGGISGSAFLRHGPVLTGLAAVAVWGSAGISQAEPGVSLRAVDGSGLSFEQSSVPAPEGQSTTVTVRGADGTTMQTISTPYKGWLDTAAIELSDLDLDGREELLIETDGRTVDHRWAVWRAVGQELRFLPAGIVAGHPENARPGLAKIKTAAGELLYTFEDGVLTQISGPSDASTIAPEALPGGRG